MKRFDAVLFDLDGTLIHSAPDLRAAVNVALVELGREPLDLSKVISFIGNGVEKLVERSLVATGGATPQLLDASLKLFRESYEQNLTTLTRPFPGVEDCLRKLKSDGVKLGICTNKPTEPAKAICDQLGLGTFFDVILGAEPDKPKKPDPAPLLSCIAALGGNTGGALYVGDSEVDYQTARNAGVPFRLFSLGYLKAELPDLGPSDRFDDWNSSGI